MTKILALIKSVLMDVDNQGSSKRVALLWLAIVIWTIIGLFLFLIVHPFQSNLASSYIYNTCMMIGGFGGLVYAEKVWGRPSSTITTTTTTA